MKWKRGCAPPPPRGEAREVVKVERLKNGRCRDEYVDYLKNEWDVQKERMIGDVEEEWTAFKNAVIRSVGSGCGMKRLCY